MIYIYGTGTLGRIVARLLRKQKIQFTFVDNYYQATNLLGAKVKRTRQVTASKEDKIYQTVKRIPVSKNSEEEIRNEIENMGFAEIGGIEEIGHDFPEAFKIFASDGLFWRSYSDPKKPIWHEKMSSEFRAWLCDERSIELFDNIKAFRLNPTVENYILPDIGKQYIAHNISNFPSYEQMHILDLGAFDGDTVRDFLFSYKNKINSFLCFEPDENNFKKLEKTLSVLQEKYEFEAQSYQIATGKENQLCSFNAKHDSSSSISKQGNSVVRMVRLDDFLKDTYFNYLKIDIEGGELDTISGAKELIKKNKPDMAISLYHKPEDFWLLPHKIKSLLPDTKMYLRQHHHFGFELTLYVTYNS